MSYNLVEPSWNLEERVKQMWNQKQFLAYWWPVTALVIKIVIDLEIKFWGLTYQKKIWGLKWKEIMKFKKG